MDIKLYIHAPNARASAIAVLQPPRNFLDKTPVMTGLTKDAPERTKEQNKNLVIKGVQAASRQHASTDRRGQDPRIRGIRD